VHTQRWDVNIQRWDVNTQRWDVNIQRWDEKKHNKGTSALSSGENR
jgi:hypothetical protein